MNRSMQGRARWLAAIFRSERGHHAAAGATLLLSPRRFLSAQALITAFYVVLGFFAVNNLFSWSSYLATAEVTPRWPVFWLRYVPLESGILFILGVHLLGGLLALSGPRGRPARIFVFFSLLQFLAFKFSFGSINHGDHLGVLIAFVLIFLPAEWRSFPAASRQDRVATLLVFSGVQGMILLTYSMAGLWKVGGVVEQLLRGEVTYLHPQGLAQQVAHKLLSSQNPSLLGPWLIEYAWIGWPLIVAALYLEFFALWAAPRPSLHAFWGLGLILLHISTHLTMGVGFAQNSLWLGLFLVQSPFRPAHFEGKHVWGALPGSHLLARPRLGRKS